jgi:hypothetical protein
MSKILVLRMISRMKIRLVSTIIVAAAGLALAIAMVTSIAGCGGSSGTVPPPDPLLPRNYVLLLSSVTQYFDSITQQASTGEDSTAQGEPNATRAVFFTDEADTHKVTISVDRYNSTSDAVSAYQSALEKSKQVPGFTPITIPSVGQKSFAGTVTQGTETHVGLGALDGKFVFGVTLAGFYATHDNVDNLVGLARAENAAINAASAQ